MQDLLLSVIVPIYNVEKYLTKCLDSIINSTYSQLEIVLVDDGATDESGKICDRYALNDDRIKVIHKANGGLISARKAGVRAASGHICSFVDGYDYIDDELYKKLLRRILEFRIPVELLIYNYSTVLLLRDLMI